MLRSALAELRAHPSRFAAVWLSILLGVAFACGTMVFTSSFHTALRHAAAADVSRVDVVVTADNGPLDLAKIAGVPGVGSVEPAAKVYPDFHSASGRGTLAISNIPVDQSHRWYTLSSGHWPTGRGQLVVDNGTAVRHSWLPGSQITLGDSPDERVVTVVGTVDTSISPLADSSDSGYATMALITAEPGFVVERADVLVSSGSSPATVAAAITAAGTSARTGTAVADQAVRQIGGDTDVLTVILLAFVALAGLVAAMVVANTFTILLTQRRRQIGLLRSVGATRAQVRRSTLLEALLIAVAGALSGLVVGIGLGRIACALVGVNGSDVTFDVLSLASATVIGIVVSVAAALAPTRQAMRIPPVAALRPVDDKDRRRTVGRTRMIIGGLLFAGGCAILAGGVHRGLLIIAMVGGAMTALGVLVLLRVVLPALLRLAALLGARLGVTSRLAIANTMRNPARASATCTALVVGVGAIVTLLVAAASAQAGADRTLGARSPLDLQVSTVLGPLPSTLASTLGSIDGMQAVVVVPATKVTVDGTEYTLFGPSIAALSTVRNGGELSPGQVAMPADLVTQLGLHSGDPITIRRAGATATLKVATRPLTDDGSLVVLSSDLGRLDPHPVPGAVWGKFKADAPPNDVIARVNTVVAPLSDLSVSGSGVKRAATADLLGTLIRIALALLAVTALISVVGIGNTLGLSVIERTRESALLRALGLRRRQLRIMLAVEAALLALVASAIGLVFGVAFGWAAAGAAFEQAHQIVVLALPIGRLTLVCVGAVLAGVVASIVPGRRAAKATPTQALMEV